MSVKAFTRAVLGLSLAALYAFPAAAVVEPGTIQLRGRIIGILPNDDSGELHEVGVGSIPDSGVSVDDAFVPEFDFTVFLGSHLSLEIIAATANHDIDAEGSLKGLGLGQIADTNVLPPTLLLQWQFRPDEKFRPYLGAGINYTWFYDEDVTSDVEAALGGDTDISLDGSFGWAAQFGFDIAINESWFFNFDIKYIDMETTATMKTDLGGGVYDKYKIDVDIDPWVPGIGFGYRFGQKK